jgi:hypothetical protein
LIPCGWLSEEEAVQIRAIPTIRIRCVLDEHLLVLTLRDADNSLLAIFNEVSVAAVPCEDRRIATARDALEQTAPESHKQKLDTAIDRVKVLVDTIRGLD